MCETGYNNMTFTIVEQKITLEYLKAYLDTLILLKTAYLRHFEHFTAIEKFKKKFLLQITMNMCEIGHNNMTFTTVEQKIALEYLEAYLRYTDFA